MAWLLETNLALALAGTRVRTLALRMAQVTAREKVQNSAMGSGAVTASETAGALVCSLETAWAGVTANVSEATMGARTG